MSPTTNKFSKLFRWGTSDTRCARHVTDLVSFSSPEADPCTRLTLAYIEDASAGM